MSLYLIVSATLFFGLGINWRRDDFLNTLIKTLLIVLSIIGLILWLELNGYLIQATK